MKPAVRFAAFLVAVLIATSAWAQARSFEGSVARMDRDANVVVFQDGQAVRIAPGTVIMHDGQTTTIAGLQPGMRVTIRDGEPVTMRDGRYVASTMQPGAQQPMQQPRVTMDQEQLTTTVQAPQPRISVEVPPQQVIVQQQPAEVVVRQSEPQVQLQPAPQPQVRIEQQPRAQLQQQPAQQQPMTQQPMQPTQQQPAASPPAQVRMEPQDLTATVQAPQARISVEVPPQRVIVQQQPAEIVVRQSEPQVTVQPAPQPQVRLEGPRAEAAPPAAAVPAEPRVADRQVTQESPTVVRPDFPAAAATPAPVVSPWCEGAYAQGLGTNFGACVEPAR